MLSFKDKDGKMQEVKLDAENGMALYKEAAAAQMTVPQYVNQKYETNAEQDGTAFEQFMAACGLFMHADRQFGIRPPSMRDVIDGVARMDAGVIVRDANPASRILFPAVFLEAVENKLKVDSGAYCNQFDSMIAISDDIVGARFEQPVLNFSRPEGHRSQGISQLALPNAMLSITSSDVARKIPTFSLGMEISNEAMQASSLDLVSLALARQAEIERTARVDEYINAFLSGDADMGSSALTTRKAVTLDATVTGNLISHKAWLKYLKTNYRKRHIDWIMCDLDTALAIENRTGKPTYNVDDPRTPRIDALMSVSNPQWQPVKIFLLEDGTIPAWTVMGLDSRYAIRKVRNSQADYAATEDFVLRKSKALRYDFGEVAYRLFDEAWDILQLVP